MADRGMPSGGALGAGSPPDPRGSGAGVNRGMGGYTDKSREPIRQPYTMTEDSFSDGTDPEKMARLYEESVGYENLASKQFVVEQARAAVMSSLDDVYNVMEFLRNKWLILYRLYRTESLNQFSYGRMNLHSPEPYKIVETFLPKIMRTLFGDERWFKLYGETNEHDANSKAQEILCRDQLRECGFLSKASRFVRDGLIYGTSVQKVYWRQETGEMNYRKAKRIPDPKGMPGQTKVELEKIERKELVFDGNDVDNVSIFDFFTSPSASDMDDAEWAADRSSWADHKVKRMGELGHWKNLGALRNNTGSNDTTFGDEFKERKAYSYGVFDPRHASQAPHIPHYTVIDWWGPLVIQAKDGSYDTRMCNVVMIDPDGLKLIVRVTVNPFWHQKKPYVVWKPIDLEDEMYGIGALEPIARLSMEKDTKRNLLMAATQLEANPMWMISDEANIPDGQLILQPGGTIRVPNLENSIAPLHVPQVSDAALKAENILTKDIRETSGATSPTMGAVDPFAKDKTATQHMAEIDEGNMRLLPMINNYENQVVKPLLNQMSWNNQQFASYPKVVRELGPMGMRFHDRYEIRPEDLIGRFIVQPLASHKLTTKQTQVQQLVNILDRAPIINQMYGPNAVKMPKLLALILEQGFDIRNVDEFISVPPEEAGLLTAIEEHEMWYHGNVPPRKPDDNDMRHAAMHMEEMGTERFELLEKTSPGTAARARAHTAEHMRKLALLQEIQEGQMMLMAQAAQMQGLGGGGGGGSPVAGAAGPGQDPGSPKVRSNETERGEGSPQSEGMQGAPNLGAQ